MVAEEKRTDFEVGASLGEVCKYKSPLPSVSLAGRGCQGVNRAGKYDISLFPLLHDDHCRHQGMNHGEDMK